MKFIQASPKVKFNESIDVAVNLGVDPTKSDQNVRGATTLPAGSGKPCKVAVFAVSYTHLTLPTTVSV